MNICFCGAGQFGFALLKHLERKYQDDAAIKLFTYDADETLRRSLQESYKHAYIDGPNSFISEKVAVCNNVEELVLQADILVLATNSAALPDIFANIKRLNKQELKIINVAKALDYTNSCTYSVTADKILAGIKYHYAVLVGGSIASDLLKGEPLGLTLACKDMNIAKQLTKIFEDGTLKIYSASDVIGVEAAAAFKNIISLMSGLISGLGLPYGTVTYMITSAAKEITDFVVRNYRAKPETFNMYSQHWGNDMWMSATGETRNRKYGELIGKGKTPDEAFAEMNTRTVESLLTLQGVYKSPDFNNLVILKELHGIFIARTESPVGFREFILAHKF